MSLFSRIINWFRRRNYNSASYTGGASSDIENISDVDFSGSSTDTYNESNSTHHHSSNHDSSWFGSSSDSSASSTYDNSSYDSGGSSSTYWD